MLKTRPLPLLALLLASCHLVDQRDFDRNAGKRPVPPAVKTAQHPQPHLVTIRFDTPSPNYQQAVADAARSALSLKPGALFTVTTLVPGAASIDSQYESASAAAPTGQLVAQAIEDAGAQPGQILQQVRVDPGVKVKEITVDVR